MASQPPARSWFRLASIARMEAAEAAAAAARATATPPTALLPRTPIPMPQQQPTSPPPPPPTPQPQQPSTPPPQPPKVQPPPPPPSPPTPRDEPQPELPATPTPQPEIQTRTPTTEEEVPPPSSKEPQRPTPVATPLESPMVIKPSYFSPPRSPTARQNQITPTQLPPNPVPEPEPEPELETKRPPPPLSQSFSTTPDEKTITNSNGRRVNNVSYNKQQGPSTKEEKQLRLITIAGDNTGAVMDIGSAALRRLGHLIHQADGNGHGRKMEQEHADGKKVSKTAAKTKHMEAMVNSNVQGINNSIVLNSSTSQHSPGVHITFASNRKPKGGASSSSDKEDHSDHIR